MEELCNHVTVRKSHHFVMKCYGLPLLLHWLLYLLCPSSARMELGPATPPAPEAGSAELGSSLFISTMAWLLSCVIMHQHPLWCLMSEHSSPFIPHRQFRLLTAAYIEFSTTYGIQSADPSPACGASSMAFKHLPCQSCYANFSKASLAFM